MFSVEHHVFFHVPEETSTLIQSLVESQAAILDAQNQIMEAIRQVVERQILLTPGLQRLTDEVAQTRTATQSVLTLIGGLAQQIRDNVNDEAALNALADGLDENEQEIVSAVSANTSGGDGGTGTPGTPPGGETPV